MPEEGKYVICDKCNIWYHPECEGLDIDDIPESGIPYYLQEMCEPKEEEKQKE